MEEKEMPLFLQFKVFGFLAGEAWELWEKVSLKKEIFPQKILFNLKERIGKKEKNAELKKTFYIPVFEDQIVEDLIRFIDFRKIPRFTMRARLLYAHIRNAAEKEGVTVASTYIEFDLNKGLLPEPEPKMKIAIIDPENTSYFYQVTVNNWKTPGSFKNLIT